MGARILISSLATFGATVAGIAHSYDLADEPPQVGRDKLPGLLIGNVILPGSGWKTSTFMGNAPQGELQVDHLLLVTAFDAKYVRAKALPKLLDLYDAYIAAAQAAKFLNYETNPVRQAVINFKADYGNIEIGDGNFYGIIFSHTYTLNM